MNYTHHLIDDDDRRAVDAVLRSAHITQGNTVREFEDALCEYTGAKYCVVVNSGTAALNLAYRIVNTEHSDLLTTANTFIATVAPAIDCDLIVDYCDIDFLTYNMQSCWTDGILVPVHFAGLPVPLEYDKPWCDGPIIEDACHALGAIDGIGDKIGSCKHTDMCVFSFHPAKTITTGEGGAVMTNDRDIAEEMRDLRNHGRINGLIGYNYRMPDINAALGISQLKKIDGFLSRRKEIFKRYNAVFEGLFKTPIYSDKSACNLYVGWFNERDLVQTELAQMEIGTQIHYRPTYKHFNPEDVREDLPVTEEYYKHCLTLPLYPAMTENDIITVIEGVRRALDSIK